MTVLFYWKEQEQSRFVLYYNHASRYVENVFTAKTRPQILRKCRSQVLNHSERHKSTKYLLCFELIKLVQEQLWLRKSIHNLSTTTIKQMLKLMDVDQTKNPLKPDSTGEDSSPSPKNL